MTCKIEYFKLKMNLKKFKIAKIYKIKGCELTNKA